MLQTEDLPTIQDRTYQILRQWLTVGKFLPGERLKIRTVAAGLGVGTMPVRAALQRLAAEGALQNIPNCGVVVPQLNRAQFDDVLRVRLLLEGEAAEQGACQLSDAGLVKMADLTARMSAAIVGKDAKSYLQANEDFHVTLYKAAGSRLLMALIETVWLKVGPISNQLFDDMAVSDHLNHAHQDVMTALRQRDGAGVRSAIEQDLIYAGRYLKSVCVA